METKTKEWEKCRVHLVSNLEKTNIDLHSIWHKGASIKFDFKIAIFEFYRGLRFSDSRFVL